MDKHRYHSISMKILSVTHWNVSDTFNKFQLCTSNLTFPTHESNYIYCYMRFGNGFRQSNIDIEQSSILSNGASFNIDENAVPHTLKCVWHGHKFQLCTSNLTVPTHESNYVYRYVRFANSFSYKAILTLAIDILSTWCIIQYRWKFCPSHIEMCLTRSTNFSYVHLI